MEGDRKGARIISFDPSQEFLAYLATTPRSHKFRMSHKRIYINGGIRSDTATARKTPLLTPEAASVFVNGAKDSIMRSSMRQHGADPKSFRYYRDILIYFTITYNVLARPNTNIIYLPPKKTASKTNLILPPCLSFQLGATNQ